MRGHNICFHSEIRKIIFELSSIPPHTGPPISSVTGLLRNRIMTHNIQIYLSLKKTGETNQKVAFSLG